MSEIRPDRLRITHKKMNCDNRMKVDQPLPDANPFFLLIGPPGSGKTNLLLNLFTEKGRFYNKCFDRVHFFSPSLHTIDGSLDLPKERFHTQFEDLEQILAECEKRKKSDKDYRCALIFDDFSHAFKGSNNKEMLRICQNRRHLGLSIFIVGQKLTKIPLELRASASALCWFFSPNGKEQTALREEFLLSYEPQAFQHFLRTVFAESHDFIFVDMKNGKVYKNFIESIEPPSETQDTASDKFLNGLIKADNENVGPRCRSSPKHRGAPPAKSSR